MNPSILLMDEPLGSLDAPTRRQSQNSLLEIWKVIPKTIIFITHNIRESILLGDRVVIMYRNPEIILKIIEISPKRPQNSSTEEFLKIYKEIVSKFPFEKTTNPFNDLKCYQWPTGNTGLFSD
ncbi:MAG: hypothetical protein ACFFC6_12660 [Promethearchaeota archaeon]